MNFLMTKPAMLRTAGRWLCALILSASVNTVVQGGNDHHHNETDQHEAEHKEEHADENSHEHDSDEEHVEIDAVLAKEAGIKTAIAEAGTIHQQLRVFGKLVVRPSDVAHQRARFPGVITQVNADVGDEVKQGSVLAIIEANESLQQYPLRASITGRINTREATIGEVTGDEPLFTVISTDTLWAELNLFPNQRRAVQQGQTVQLDINGQAVSGTIARLMPSHNDTPYQLARVVVQNRESVWTPGDWVQADITTEQVDVSLVVNNKALQVVEGQTVVFVKQDDRYRAQPVTLGRRDLEHTEILSGLHVGNEYVAENSYLIKADLEKSGAAHQH